VLGRMHHADLDTSVKGSTCKLNGRPFAATSSIKEHKEQWKYMAARNKINGPMGPSDTSYFTTPTKIYHIDTILPCDLPTARMLYHDDIDIKISAAVMNKYNGFLPCLRDVTRGAD